MSNRRTIIGETVPTAYAPSGLLTPLSITAPTSATNVLTSDNTNVSNGDTVKVGTTIYTFVTALSSVVGQVLIGGSADASLTNLAAAINGTGGGNYFGLRPNAQFTSSAVASHALTFTAINNDSSGGPLGNEITASTTSAHLSFASATFTGGSYGALNVNSGGGSGAAASQVQGTAADNAVAVGNPVLTGGVAEQGSTYSPAYTAGDAAQIAVDKDNGGVLCDTRLLTTGDVVTNVPKGAPNFATGQVTTSTTAATFVSARSTRRSVTLKNLDLTITVYFGPATVTSGNGMPLKAGESVMVDTTALIQVISASGTPVVAFAETYD